MSSMEQMVKIFISKLPSDVVFTSKSDESLKCKIPYKDAVIYAQLRYYSLNMWIENSHVKSVDDRVYGRTVRNYNLYKEFWTVTQLESFDLERAINDVYKHKEGIISCGSLGT